MEGLITNVTNVELYSGTKYVSSILVHRHTNGLSTMFAVVVARYHYIAFPLLQQLIRFDGGPKANSSCTI